MIYRLICSGNDSDPSLFRRNNHLDAVSILFAQLSADGFQNADDITDVSIFIPDTHIDDTAVIGNTVKSDMNFEAAFAEFFSDIIREDDVGSAFAGNLMKDGRK